MSENVKKKSKIGHSDKEKERNNMIVNCVKKNQQHDLTWDRPTQGWATNTTNEWTQLREELEEEPLLTHQNPMQYSSMLLVEEPRKHCHQRSLLCVPQGTLEAIG